MKFRKKPVVIDAVQWTGSNTAEVADFMGSRAAFPSSLTESWLEIETLEGTMRASRGDWIIRGVQGEFYPCKPDIFEATYEACEACGADSASIQAAVDEATANPGRTVFDAAEIVRGQ